LIVENEVKLQSELVVLSSKSGELERELNLVNCPVAHLPLDQGMLKSIYSLVKLFQKIRAHDGIVQTWMYHAALVAGSIACIMGKPVFWSIHHNELNNLKFSTRVIARVCGWASSIIPRGIAVVSDPCMKTHVDVGYDRELISVIHAGIKIDRFNDVGHNTASAGLKVGLAARFSPEKDLGNFFSAMCFLRQWFPSIEIALCGESMDVGNNALIQIMESNGIEKDSVQLLGILDNMSDFFASLDVLVVSSKSESFGIVLAEALLCGALAVSTDVGEARKIIADDRLLASVGDSASLANSCFVALNMTEDERKLVLEEARVRISEKYSITKMSSKYNELWGL
jgi:glycosyltransferase involved in cell wall biosynthesis